MTVECPNEIQQLPWNSGSFHRSTNYWILDKNTVYHQGRKKGVQFNTQDLKVGDTIFASVHEDGNLHYYVNGIDRGISVGRINYPPTRQCMVLLIYGGITTKSDHYFIMVSIHQ